MLGVGFQTGAVNQISSRTFSAVWLRGQPTQHRLDSLDPPFGVKMIKASVSQEQNK